MKYSDYINKYNSVLENLVVSNKNENIETQTGLSQIIDLLNVVDEDATIYMIGNGGSSGIVSHSMVDFINACKKNARAITDNSLLTCMANDYGYENVFKQPFATMIRKKDAVIAISSSGNSENIVSAAKFASDKGCKVITFSGFKSENKLRKEGDLNIWLESDSYGYVEIGHALILHYITDSLSGMIK
ncbi:MAG: SIS domain-containing protein [Cyclobacteriaceae bacterium]